MNMEAPRIRFEFLSTLAHELKAPLNALETSIDTLEYLGENRPEELGAAYERMRLRVQGMRKLIIDLLDLTRLESGSRERNISLQDIREICHEVVASLKNDADAKQVTISVHCASPVLFEVDPDELVVVIHNLLSNAIKYNKDRGRIDIHLKKENDGLLISVSDTGLGISKEEETHLFREFSRIRNNETKHITGSGLGLSIVKKIVELYDGELSLQSVKGQGTVFNLILRKHKERETP